MLWLVLIAVVGCGLMYFLSPGTKHAPVPQVAVVPQATPEPVVEPSVMQVEPPPPAPKVEDNSGEVARVAARIEAVRMIEAVRPLMVRRDVAGASKLLGEWLAERPEHPQRALVEHQVARLRALEQVMPALLGQPAALAGAQIPVGRATWPVAGVANGRLVCRVQAQFGVVDRPVEFSALSEAAVLVLLQRVDAVTHGTVAPAYELALGKSAEASAVLRGTGPKVEVFRADLEEFDQVARDGAVLAELDGVENLLARQERGSAQERLEQCEKAHPGHEFITIAYAAKISAWRAQIARASAPAPMPAAAPAVADSYPGLPVFTLSATVPNGDPERKQLLKAAEWAASTGKWDRHFTQLKSALATAAASGSWVQHAQNLEHLIGLGTPALATEQARFIRAAGPTALATFSGANEKNREFLGWLFTHQAVLASFNDTIKPKTKGGDPLTTWRIIWDDDKENRESLASLAIACALVFEKPVAISADIYGFPGKGKGKSDSAATAGASEVSALSRYRFYRDSFKKGSLKVPLNEMTPWELIWVVDAPVPDSELVWAQKHANFTRNDWGKAYGHIRYRMDRATQGVNPYNAYTLAEIEKEGGICGDQAYFAAITAKANGIPAMVISGEGDRGGHAWVGYEAGRAEWRLDAGRYADNYAAGTTRDPQTGSVIKEHELRQLTDPNRRTGGFEKSVKFVALATLLADAGQNDLANRATTAALTAAPKNFDAWTAKLDHLAAAKAPSEEWLRESARMRTTFKEYSDLVTVIDKREADYVAVNGSADAARKLVHLQTGRMERKDGERSDLIVDSVFREVELAEKAGDSDKAGRIFRDALRDKGQEVVPFKKIASRYYAWAKTKDKGPETVRELISFFDRKHKEPTTDVFAIRAFREVLTLLTGMAKEQDLEPQQKSLERREAKLKDLEEKQGKLQSRGADR